MKTKKWFLAVLVLLGSTLFAAAAEEGRFFIYPTIHNDKIVFTYENDLWTVSSQGGLATRLTTFPGNEFFAKFSPDGKWLAFTASYDGAPAVYLMPAEGGSPTRLTYHPGGAQVIAWSPDGMEVIYRSGLENYINRDPALYSVNRKGGAPIRLLDRGVLISFIPEEHKFLYNRKGTEEYYWKRYKGGQYMDIWLADPVAKKYTPVTDYIGRNSYPMWINGLMYFVSDRSNGICNFFTQKLGTKDVKQITRYDDVDVMYANTDGQSIVYVQDGRLHVFDVKAGQDRKIAVQIPSDRWALRSRVINPRNYIHTANLSDDGRTVVLEARGDVFRVPLGHQPSENLSNTPGTREAYPALSPDGKTIAFFSDKSGDYQLYTQSVDGGEWTALTTDLDRTNYKLAWSPDGKKILFGNKDYSLFFVDVAAKKRVKIDSSNQMKNDEYIWEMADYSWSPDSKWVAYSFVQYNRNSQIFIYNIETGKKCAVTNDFYDNLYPSFDAAGKYLYFVSSRNFDVQMDFYEDNHVYPTPQQVMVVQLRDGEKPPFAADGGVKTDPKADPFHIDPDGLLKRTYPLPVPAGNYFYLKAGKGKVLWAAIEAFTETEYEEIFRPKYYAAKWNLHVFDMASRRDSILGDKISDFSVSANGEQLLISKDNDIFATGIDRAFESKALGERLNLGSLVYTVDPQKEWNQIFNDAWRWYRDFFYDANFHGRDWKAMGDHYRAYIPFLSSRNELNWVLSQMVGELCVSHTYVNGGDFGPGNVPTSPVFTGLLGADLAPDPAVGLFKLAKIYGPTDVNLSLVGPLVRPDFAVKEGDYILAINGTPLKAGDDYFKLLQTTAGRKIKVTVNAKPTLEGAKTYDVEPIRGDTQLRYFRWIEDNIKAIEKATAGRVGYLHVNAMNADGIGEFDKFWRAFRYKDGVIIDMRRNSGGWTEYFLIDKLERVMTSQNVLRGMVPFRYPGAAGNGNYVVISNEYNGSDGEAFVDHFKARKLGTVVGVPSWGGLVGILNQQVTIDNGTVEQSNNSFYGRDSKWIVENHGADPDILVDNDPASIMAGRDLQLEKAIEVMLDKIKKNPPTFPPTPAYLKK
jgi:tricorn protease